MMKKRKRRSGALGGSSTHHGKTVGIELRRAKTLASEGLDAAGKGRCADAFHDITASAMVFGRAQAHLTESGGHESREFADVRDKIFDAGDAMKACFRSNRCTTKIPKL